MFGGGGHTTESKDDDEQSDQAAAVVVVVDYPHFVVGHLSGTNLSEYMNFALSSPFYYYYYLFRLQQIKKLEQRNE